MRADPGTRNPESAARGGERPAPVQPAQRSEARFVRLSLETAPGVPGRPPAKLAGAEACGYRRNPTKESEAPMSAQVDTADKVLTPKSPPENLAAHAREEAEHLYRRSKERALALEGEFEDYVREKPMKAVLIAAGVGAGLGLVLGVLLARR